MDSEGWRPVKGWEGHYQVSTHGQVRRVAGGIGARVGRILRPQYDKRGYAQVRLSMGGKPKTQWVHRLVAKAFLGDAGRPFVVNHLDSNPSNNRLTNLAWTTIEGNLVHARKANRWRPDMNIPRPDNSGENNGRAVLTHQDVMQIRQTTHTSNRKLAEHYGVTASQIGHIRRGTRWKDAPGDTA
jgi:hypothetical protein